MSKANTDVKWFHSEMLNAPVCRGEAGALIELLDACLIDGFSTRTPDSITVADGVATVALSAGNPYEKHAVIKISGASDADLNDEWRIASSAPSSITFACPGVADGTASGATLIRAPGGWAKPFSDTNVGVYQSASFESTQLYLRVNDTHAQYTRVRGYENMTAADAGTGDFPLLTSFGETLATWVKSNAASSAARPWAVVTDGSMVYLVVAWHNTYPKNTDVYRFGDLLSVVSGDSYHCVISAQSVATPIYPGGNSTSSGPNTTYALNAAGGTSVARKRDQSPGAWPSCRVCLFATQAGATSSGDEVAFSDMWEFDAAIYNYASAQNALLPRGKSPGFYLASNSGPALPTMGVIEREGDALFVVPAGRGSGTIDAYAAFDVKGPWR